MNRMIKILLICAIGVVQGFADKSAKEQLQYFPQPQADSMRHVVLLPKLSDTEMQDVKVELIVGKMIQTDGVNHYGLTGALIEKDLEGFGYTYYQIEGEIHSFSTLMASVPRVPSVQKFVTLQSVLVAYNSKLPIVIYTPKGFEVHYRLWKAQPKAYVVKP